MLEQFLPFLAPKNEFQSNANYLAGLYGTHQILSRLFPSDKEKLEALLIRRELKALEGSEESQAQAGAAAIGRMLSEKLQKEKIYEMPAKAQSVLQSILKTYEPGVTSEFMLRRAAQMAKPKNVLKAVL